MSDESPVEREAHKLLREEAHRCLGENRAFDAADAMAAVKPLLDQLHGMRETTARLNRRCQAAEAAALQNVKACVGAGLSFSRTLANWYALRLTDELVHVLRALPSSALEPEPLGQPWAHELAERIRHTIPEEASLLNWRRKQTQPKASARDGEIQREEPECEVCHGPCQGH